MFWQSQVSGRLAGTLWKHRYWSLQLNIFGWEKYFNYTAGRGGVMVRWVDMDINNSTGSRVDNFVWRCFSGEFVLGKYSPLTIALEVLCCGGVGVVVDLLLLQQLYTDRDNCNIKHTWSCTTPPTTQPSTMYLLSPPLLTLVGGASISHQVGAAALWWSQGS